MNLGRRPQGADRGPQDAMRLGLTHKMQTAFAVVAKASGFEKYRPNEFRTDLLNVFCCVSPVYCPPSALCYLLPTAFSPREFL